MSVVIFQPGVLISGEGAIQLRKSVVKAGLQVLGVIFKKDRRFCPGSRKTPLAQNKNPTLPLHQKLAKLIHFELHPQ